MTDERDPESMSTSTKFMAAWKREAEYDRKVLVQQQLEAKTDGDDNQSESEVSDDEHSLSSETEHVNDVAVVVAESDGNEGLRANTETSSNNVANAAALRSSVSNFQPETNKPDRQKSLMDEFKKLMKSWVALKNTRITPSESFNAENRT
jgi:hypothetical protein